MTVAEWLMRLDLAELAPQFIKNKIYSITDLRNFMEEKHFDQAGFEFKKRIQKMRLLSMIHGKDNVTKEDFKFITANQGRQIMKKFVKNTKYLEELVSIMKDDLVTGF